MLECKEAPAGSHPRASTRTPAPGQNVYMRQVAAESGSSSSVVATESSSCTVTATGAPRRERERERARDERA